MQTPRVLALIGDETACSLWRVWQPFNELERRGFVAEWCHKDDSEKVLPLVASGRYNLITTPRIVWPQEGVGDQWINVIHKAGIAWIYECDDDVYSPGITSRQVKLFESERLKGEEQLEWERLERIRLLSQCDGVTVSSQRLATIVRNYAPEDVPVAVVPNAIDAKWFRDTLKGCGRIPELDGKLTIGWAGGTREPADFKHLAEAWSIIAERYPEVQFVVQGHLASGLVDAVPQHRRVTLPWVHLLEYPRALLNIDIGCCSVATRLFNTAKTPIKWFEMTLAGAPCVVSKTLYGNVVTNGADGFVAESVQEWVESLSALIESAELRRQIQRNARRTVMTNHSLESTWHNWIIAWASMLERFSEKRSRQLVYA